MSEWKNIGDMSPEGAVVVRDMTINAASGDFSAEAVVVTSETHVGGDECRFLIRQGDVFLSAENMKDALAVVGETPESVRDMPEGDRLVRVADAALAFGGIDHVSAEILVQIGPDEPYDQPRKFPGEIMIYDTGSSLWQIMRENLDGFDFHGTKDHDKAVLLEVREDSPEPGLG